MKSQKPRTSRNPKSKRPATVPFSELEAKLPPDARRRAARRADAIIAAVTLRELREECAELTQAQVADDLGVSQSAISQLEQRGDTMLSTLADFVSALGGELEIRANFPGGRTFKIARYH